MDIVAMIDRQHDCVSDDSPPCVSACPLGLDVRDFVRKIRAGLTSAAYKSFMTWAALPGIACHLCDEPCGDACVRRDIDEAVSLRGLELFCWRQMRDKPDGASFIPEKDKRVLVIGGGLTGICCAAKLAEKGYKVELAERGNRLGDELWAFVPDRLTEDVIERDLSRIVKIPTLSVALNAEARPEDCASYDAVLMTAGAPPDGEDNDRPANVFYADSLRQLFRIDPLDASPMRAIRAGTEMSFLLDDFVKTGVPRSAHASPRASLYRPAPQSVEPVKKSVPIDVSEWGLKEAKSEAERCVLCSCENCKNVCEMLRWHHLDAKKLMVNVSDTINKHRYNRRTGVRPAMSCVQCGLCLASCPVGIDLKRLCVETRRTLHKTEHLPSGYYDYWLNDMAHANGEESSLFLPASGDRCRYLFFPGCQMGASDPDYVVMAYKWMRETFPGETALLLRCCGAPAYWAGDEELHTRTLGEIGMAWREAGEPIFALSCPTCAELLNDFIPKIETVSIWRLMAGHLGRFVPGDEKKLSISVFDPCSSKYDPDTQRDIRALVRNAGYEIQELSSGGRYARCCGYGGLVYSSNPELVREIGEHNRALGELEFVTYCTNCRDSFAAGGKPSRHILDLLFFDETRRDRKPPDLTQRRRNRAALKKAFAGEPEGATRAEEEAPGVIRLIVPDAVRQLMNKRLILDDNVKNVIYAAETSGKRMYCEEEDIYTAYQEQGRVTYWARYRLTDDGYLLIDAYLHRMRILGG